MAKLIHACPVLVVIVFCRVYTWMNMSQRIFVERFGCGCPPLDDGWHFNTNHLSMIVLGLAGVGCLLPQLLLARRVPEKFRSTYVVAAVVVIGSVCLFTLARNIWL